MQQTIDAAKILNDAIDQFLRQQHAGIEQSESASTATQLNDDGYNETSLFTRKEIKLPKLGKFQEDIHPGKPPRRTIYATTPLPEIPHNAFATLQEVTGWPLDVAYPVPPLRSDRMPDSVAPLVVRKKVVNNDRKSLARVTDLTDRSLEHFTEQSSGRGREPYGDFGIIRRSSLARRLANDREICSPLSMLSALAMKPLMDISPGFDFDFDSTASPNDRFTLHEFLDWPKENLCSSLPERPPKLDQHQTSFEYKKILPEEPVGFSFNEIPFQDIYTWQDASRDHYHELDVPSHNANTPFRAILKSKDRIIEKARTILSFCT